jgi:hypothetical protein
MTRIIVTPASSGNDLSQRFVKAINLLNENGIKLYSGTKLVSRYAVIVAEDLSVANSKSCGSRNLKPATAVLLPAI